MLGIKGEEYHDFQSKNLVSQCRKILKGKTSGLCFRKILVAKFLWIRGGGGRVSGFPVEIFLSHSDKNFLRGTLLCFTKLPILKNVRDKRGRDSHFSVESFFVSECRKILKGNPSVLCFRKLLVAKFLWIRGGGVYQDFPSKNFRLRVPKKFIGEPFCAVFQKTSGSEKVYG